MMYLVFQKNVKTVHSNTYVRTWTHLISHTSALSISPTFQTAREVGAIAAFDVVAHLLRRQRTPLDSTVHELLTGLSGLSQSCTAGRIATPAAFRAFCLDRALWAQSPVYVQQLVFQGILRYDVLCALCAQMTNGQSLQL